MTLDGLAQEGARQLLMTALEEEVSDYIERHVQERDEKGHALVVRNGRAQASEANDGLWNHGVGSPASNNTDDKPKVGRDWIAFVVAWIPYSLLTYRFWHNIDDEGVGYRPLLTDCRRVMNAVD